VAKVLTLLFFKGLSRIYPIGLNTTI
jgi:hypothetical protein